MEARLLEYKKEEEKLSFIIKGTNHVFANTLRRLIIAEVPTMAIETVDFSKNNSVLFDEIIAHRLGLIPLSTDLIISSWDCLPFNIIVFLILGRTICL